MQQAGKADLPKETGQPTQPLGTIAITHAEPCGYLAESAGTPRKTAKSLAVILSIAKNLRGEGSSGDSIRNS